MQPTENPESNRTTEIEPAIRHSVSWRVTSVTPLPDFRLRVTFVDGMVGEGGGKSRGMKEFGEKHPRRRGRRVIHTTDRAIKFNDRE